jgi:hypothetical protein
VARRSAVAPPQLGQRTQQRAVAQLRGRAQVRQAARRGHADEGDAGRRHHEHRAPAEVLGHEAAQHARQQDAQQQPGHHRADDLAAVRLGRQRGGGRHHVLRQGGGQADHQAGHQQRPHRGRERRAEQRQHQHRGLGEDDAAPVEAVAQRRQQQDAQRIAQLRERRHEAHRARRGADVGPEHAQHGLAVVERRHAEARAGGQQHDQRGGQAFMR